jgi:hypothetical protein
MTPPFTTEDVARIAASLTKAQRATLLDGRRCVRSYTPASKLIELGLWEDALPEDEYAITPRPTPLAYAVRAHLEASNG